VLWQKTHKPIRAPARFFLSAPDLQHRRAIVPRAGLQVRLFLSRHRFPPPGLLPVYPYLPPWSFRRFGSTPWPPPRWCSLAFRGVIAASTRLNIHALGRRTFRHTIGFGAAWIWALSPNFFRCCRSSWIGILTASGLPPPRPFNRHARCRGEKYSGSCGYRRRGSGAVHRAHKPRSARVMPFYFSPTADLVNHRSFRCPGSLLRACRCACFAAAGFRPWRIRNEVASGVAGFFFRSKLLV